MLSVSLLPTLLAMAAFSERRILHAEIIVSPLMVVTPVLGKRYHSPARAEDSKGEDEADYLGTSIDAGTGGGGVDKVSDVDGRAKEKK
jgi:hypothetical protein